MAGPDDFGVAMLFLSPLAQNVARLGGDSDAFLRELGVDETATPQTFVPAARVAHAFEHLAQTLGDPSVGLSLARNSPTGSLGMFDYGLVMASSMRAAFERLQYYSLLSNRVSMACKEDGPVSRVIQRVHPDAPRVPALAELPFAIIWLRSREATGQSLAARAVNFAHPGTSSPAYESTFGVRATFNQPVNEIVFDSALLDIPFRTADPVSFGLLEQHAVQLHSKLSSVAPFIARVRTMIEQRLKTKSFDLSVVARELGMSERSVQRQIQTHGLTYRDVVEQVRREVAAELLSRPGTTLAEVAYELGFASPAAFSRAFSRWTGAPPGEFQSARRSGKPEAG